MTKNIQRLAEMYREKAAFFDAQVNAGWASNAYGDVELKKLGLLFREIGDLSGKTILEPGCGTGRLTEILSQQVGTNGKVVAFDISPEMINAAKEKAGKNKNTDIFVAEIESFPVPIEKFDLILCHQVFPHIEDKPLALLRFNNLLGLGGKIIIFHFIDFDEINNVHRKTGSIVQNDMMPKKPAMELLFNNAGFTIEFIRNDENGYFLMGYK
jgi:ubiquinone/menaquinone biosynthesis C-methylase UbiE